MGLVKIGDRYLMAERVIAVESQDHERVVIRMSDGHPLVVTRDASGRVLNVDAIATAINDALDVHRIVNAIREADHALRQRL